MTQNNILVSYKLYSAKKIEKKNAKRNAEKKKNASNKKDKDKKTPIADETFTKNIVFKKVLMP